MKAGAIKMITRIEFSNLNILEERFQNNLIKSLKYEKIEQKLIFLEEQ